MLDCYRTISAQQLKEAAIAFKLQAAMFSVAFERQQQQQLLQPLTLLEATTHIRWIISTSVLQQQIMKAFS